MDYYSAHVGNNNSSSSSSSTLVTGLLDFCGGDLKNNISSSSLGFMDLLNIQLDEDFCPSDNSVLNNNNNAPATPNYSSISSESNSGGGGGGHENDHHNHHIITTNTKQEQEREEEDHQEEEENQKTTNKHLKAKKTGVQKKQKEARFAFVTKSEVDHLEDGYRWRKYGQKAVKNSPFPRSYYRCTSASCNVKKRVERCCNDPSTVVTTYEGQHIHPSPLAMPRSTPAYAFSSSSGGGAASYPTSALDFSTPLSSYAAGYANNNNVIINSGGGTPQHYLPNFCGSSTPSSALLADHGLLQDILPSSIIKNEEHS